jgi:hypothetical protein
MWARTRFSKGLLLAALAVLLLAGLAVAGFVASQVSFASGSQSTTTLISTPYLVTDKHAEAGACEKANIELIVQGKGEPVRKPLDVMLVLDRSGTMNDVEDCGPGSPPGCKVQPLTDAEDAAKFLVDKLDPTIDRVGLVSYADTATLDQGLTNDFGAVKAAIGGMIAFGYTNIGDGVLDAQTELSNHGRADAVQVMVVLTDGIANRQNKPPPEHKCTDWPSFETDCTQFARSQAAAAKAQGTIIFTIGLNLVWGQYPPAVGNLARDVLKDMAGPLPGRYYEAPTSSQLQAIFGAIVEIISNTAGYDVKVIEVLPSYMHYTTATAKVDGVPTEPSISGQTLTWDLGDVLIGQEHHITLSVDVDAAATGHSVLADDLTSRAEYLDYLNNAHVAYFPERWVTVQPCGGQQFVVKKDFSDNNSASVTVSLSCPGASVSPASASASQATAATFTVTGYEGNPTCTATESPVPSGYTSSGTCNASLSAGECTITNTLRSHQFVVKKDFSDNNSASVTVSLSCPGASVSPGSASASEASPATFTVTGYSGDPTCTATESPVPSGYTSSGTCNASLSAGECTITNTLRSHQFVVKKDFSDNNSASVTVSLSCPGASVSPGSASASEGSPATFTVTGYSGDPACMATESPIPSGYNSTGTCAAALSAGECTITNTLRSHQFVVKKDFSDNNSASVTVSLSCPGASVSPGSASASEGSPATFTVTGYSGDPTCTATESPIPTGYNSSGTCGASLSAGECTITNTLRSHQFVVKKDFSDNNSASVTVSLSCPGASVSPGSASASEASPATFTVTGYSGDPTCTATESPIPTGYNSSGTCGASLSAGECTITNTLRIAQFTVKKDFSDNNSASVTVSLSCPGASVSPGSGSASEASPATFTVTGYSGDPACTATESPIPTGYNSSGTCAAALSAGECTITNTATPGSITVVKNVVGEAPGSDWGFTGPSGSFTLPAGGGQRTFGDLDAGEYTISETTKDGYTPSVSCTSGEGGSDSVTVDLSPGGSITCTFINSSLPSSITVVKNVVGQAPDSDWVFTGPSGSFTLPAGGGQQTFGDLDAGQYIISETAKDGYTASVSCTGGETGSDSVTVELSPGGTVICTFTNRITAQFVVNKDFAPDSGAQVVVSLSCTSGSVVNDDTSASEADPANFTVMGFSLGTTCTASEAVPAGYTPDESDCLNVDLTSDGVCTIVNTFVPTVTPTPTPTPVTPVVLPTVVAPTPTVPPATPTVAPATPTVAPATPTVAPATPTVAPGTTVTPAVLPATGGSGAPPLTTVWWPALVLLAGAMALMLAGLGSAAWAVRRRKR